MSRPSRLRNRARGFSGGGAIIPIPDIGGNMLARWAADESDFSLVGNEVALWEDIGSGSYDALGHVSDGTRRPLYNATGWDGIKPCVTFDGVNDYLAFSSIPNTDGTDVFVVASASNLMGNRHYVGGTAAGSPNITIDSTGKIRFNRQSQAVLAITPAAISTAPYVVNAIAKSPTNYIGLFLNGVLQQESPLPASLTSGYATIGATSAAGTYSGFLEGKIAEIIVYDGNLTEFQRTQIVRTLRNKWGV